jgi:hypothetical protein
MADEILGAPSEPQAENPTPVQEGTIPEPEPTPEEVALQEEQVELPSDVEEVEIPEKFQGKSQEEIIKAYLELEKKLGQKEPETPTEEPKEEPNEEPKEEPKEGEIDGASVFKEYLESGDLSEETWAKLEEAGYKREEVKERLEFEKYKQDKAIEDLVAPIGGIEEYTKLTEWAKENVDELELGRFMEEFEKAGPMAKKAMLKDAYTYYKAQQESGQEPTMVHSNEPQYKPTKGYSSQHELQKDLSDPRYGIDRSYTQAVEEKMAISDLSKL